MARNVEGARLCSGFVGLGAVAGVGGFGEGVVAGFLFGAAETGVLTFEAAGPAVMPGSGTWCCIGLFADVFAVGIGERSDSGKRSDEFGVGGGEFEGEFADRRGESGDSGTVVGGSGSEVGNGINSFLLVGCCVGRAIASASGGGARVSELAMGTCKEGFEGDPGFVSGRFAVPDFAIVMKHARGKNDLETVGDNLRWRVGSVAGGSVFHGRLDLGEQSFNG